MTELCILSCMLLAMYTNEIALILGLSAVHNKVKLIYTINILGSLIHLALVSLVMS